MLGHNQAPNKCVLTTKQHLLVLTNTQKRESSSNSSSPPSRRCRRRRCCCSAAAVMLLLCYSPVSALCSHGADSAWSCELCMHIICYLWYYDPVGILC